ncbi:hypothetical protein, partial [Bacillus altitudinis]|uniref:hypothetical protein n=1 Tax=Bacillus altitudinis TaxID=293387 RepID=UPI001C92E980
PLPGMPSTSSPRNPPRLPMLFDLAPAAAANAEGEQKLLAEEAELNGQGFSAADWPYWQSKVRARDFSLDEE